MFSNKYLSSTSLKIIAILTMLIDHIGFIFYPDIIDDHSLYLSLRLIGRIAFPIFTFLLVEGFYHTRNRNHYLIRLGIFALVTEVIFDLAFYDKLFYWQHQNVLFTFAIGLIAIDFYDKNVITNPTKGTLAFIIIAIISEVFRSDYGLIGIGMIFAFTAFRSNFKALAISIIIINVMTITNFNYLESMLQAFASLALIFIYLYNGKRGFNLKYFFYWFYPVHLLILYLIKMSIL
jgi:TraX protein